MPPAVIWWSHHLSDRMETASERSPVLYYLAVAIAAVSCGLVFYIFRVRAHFLGDGITSLSYLASDNPLLHSPEFGESLLHIWLKKVLPGSGGSTALLSFQFLSVFAGVSVVVTVAIAARSIFDKGWQRLGFVLVSMTGGYAVLFFGYVEYYSVFTFSVVLFAIIGLLILRGRMSRWWIVPSLALSAWLHILGVTLIPSALYVLLHGSRTVNWFSRFPRHRKVFLGAVGILAAMVVFWYYYDTNIFFELAIVPLISNRFTVDGYTMFSASHLLDFGNLLVLLLPALPLLVVEHLRSGKSKWTTERTYLLLTVFATLGAAFIFDPRMGMPRDWNLFAFAGVPLAMYTYYVLLFNDRPVHKTIVTGVLMVSLGILSLGGRVATQNSIPSSLHQFENYISLDPGKCAKARSVIVNFFKAEGDTSKAEAEQQLWISSTPEKKLFDQAYQLIERGNCQRGIAAMKKVIDLNPLWQDAWSNIGLCLMRMAQFDSAMVYMDVALGLNPYDAATLSNRGVTQMYRRQFDKAERDLLASVALDNSQSKTHENLIILYYQLREPDKLLAYLERAGRRSNSPMLVYKELGKTYRSRGRWTEAKAAFDRAMSLGLDSAYVAGQLKGR